MNITSVLGVLIAFGAIIGGFLLEGGHIGMLLLVSPAIIVFGGTVGATILSYNASELKKVPSLLSEAFKNPPSNIDKLVSTFTEMADIAKRNGLLGLEAYVNSHPELDPILTRGVLMIMDGSNSEKVEAAMENEIYLNDKAKHAEISIFETMGGFSPTMGVIGTVMGLVHTLANMGSPEELTAAIAVAFIATLYGVGFANLLFLPLASKLKSNLKKTNMEREMILNAVLAIQKGASSRTIMQTLEPYIEISHGGAEKKANKK